MITSEEKDFYDKAQEEKELLDTSMEESIKQKEERTSKDMKFITIDKQEDLPADTFFRGRLSGAKDLEELLLPNGDIIVSNKDLQEDSTVPLNVLKPVYYIQYRLALKKHKYEVIVF